MEEFMFFDWYLHVLYVRSRNACFLWWTRSFAWHGVLIYNSL